MDYITRTLIDKLIDEKESVLSKSWFKQERVVSQYQIESIPDPVTLKEMVKHQMYMDLGRHIEKVKSNIYPVDPKWLEEKDPAIAEKYRMDYVILTREELVELLDICVKFTKAYSHVGPNLI